VGYSRAVREVLRPEWWSTTAVNRRTSISHQTIIRNWIKQNTSDILP